MNNVTWLGKGHAFDCKCPQCLESTDEYLFATQLTSIKERLKYYYFKSLEQENDFVSLMIMVEKLLEKK